MHPVRFVPPSNPPTAKSAKVSAHDKQSPPKVKMATELIASSVFFQRHNGYLGFKDTDVATPDVNLAMPDIDMPDRDILLSEQKDNSDLDSLIHVDAAELNLKYLNKGAYSNAFVNTTDNMVYKFRWSLGEAEFEATKFPSCKREVTRTNDVNAKLGNSYRQDLVFVKGEVQVQIPKTGKLETLTGIAIRSPLVEKTSLELNKDECENFLFECGFTMGDLKPDNVYQDKRFSNADFPSSKYIIIDGDHVYDARSKSPISTRYYAAFIPLPFKEPPVAITP